MADAPFSSLTVEPTAVPSHHLEGRGRGASLVTLVYMAAALPLLAVGHASGARYALILAMHLLAGLGILAALKSPGRVADVARSWLPLASIPLLYAELPFLMGVVGSAYGDPMVQAWERALWGGQPSIALAADLPWLVLSEALHLSYLSYYALIYVPLSYLWWHSGRVGLSQVEQVPGSPFTARHGFSEAALGVMATFVICFTVFVVFPVQGPRYLWPAPEAVPTGPVRIAVLAILESGSSRGAAFPSSHMAVAVVQSLMAIRWRVPGRVLIGVLTAGLGVGAVYGGFHYAIDMIAGAGTGGLVFLAVRGRGGEMLRA